MNNNEINNNEINNYEINSNEIRSKLIPLPAESAKKMAHKKED